MRILVISNLYPPNTIGGYEIQCSQAVDDLRRRGHNVLVLTSIPRLPLLDPPGTEHVLRRLSTPDVYSPERADIRSPYWEFESNLLNVENIYVLCQLLATFRPDVCYLWNLVAVGGAGIVAALEYLEVPWVWHLGDSAPAMLCNFNGELPLLGQLMGRRFSGRFLACSQTVIDKVEKLVPITGRTYIIPNWVTLPEFDTDRSYYEGGCLRLVYAGRLAEEKGIFLLLEMVAQLRSSGYVDFTLDIIGSGMIDELRTRIQELGIGDYTRVMGWLPKEQVRTHLSESDLFIFPTQWDDSFPLAPLEAASVGCVPVIPEVCGASEWLVDGVECLKSPRSVEGIADVVGSVLDGQIQLSELGRRGIQTVLGQFSLDVVIPTVERELVLAARERTVDADRIEDLYRMALIADSLLRHEVSTTANRRRPEVHT